jgi:hypothetical protein
MIQRITVRLPDELVRRAKRKAVAQGRLLTALIEDGLRRVLADGARGARVDRILPPASLAMGGLMPGINLDDGVALQEIRTWRRPDSAGEDWMVWRGWLGEAALSLFPLRN